MQLCCSDGKAPEAASEGDATDEAGGGAVADGLRPEAVLSLAGVPTSDDVVSTLFGLDPESIPNRLNCDADFSELKNLPSSDWPLSHCAYGDDFLVPLFSSVSKSTMRREMGIRLPPAQLAGLANVDARSLVP